MANQVKKYMDSNGVPIKRAVREAGLLITDLQETGKELGTGSYGGVFEVKVGGKLCAAKKLHGAFIARDVPAKDRAAMVERFEMECRRILYIKHINIIEMIGIHFDPVTSYPTLVMELMDTSLRKYLENNPESSVPLSTKYSILHDVASGLLYLHTLPSPLGPMVHRDLTANNILVALGRGVVAKIADLGQAKIDSAYATRQQTLSMIPGNDDHMPPEAWMDNPVYDASLDVFSFAVVILHTLTHEWPKPLARMKSYDAVRNEVERRECYLDKISGNPLVPMIKQCLSQCPNDRPATSDVFDDLTDCLRQYKSGELSFQAVGGTGYIQNRASQPNVTIFQNYPPPSSIEAQGQSGWDGPPAGLNNPTIYQNFSDLHPNFWAFHISGRTVSTNKSPLAPFEGPDPIQQVEIDDSQQIQPVAMKDCLSTDSPDPVYLPPPITHFTSPGRDDDYFESGIRSGLISGLPCDIGSDASLRYFDPDSSCGPPGLIDHRTIDSSSSTDIYGSGSGYSIDLYGSGSGFIQRQSSITVLHALDEEEASSEEGEDLKMSLDNREKPLDSSNGATEGPFSDQLQSSDLNSGHRKNWSKKSMSIDEAENSSSYSEKNSPQLRNTKSGTNLAAMAGQEQGSQVTKPSVNPCNKLPPSSPSPAPRTVQRDKSSLIEDWVPPKAFVQPNTLYPVTEGSSRGSSLPRQALSVDVDPGKKAVPRFPSGSNLLSNFKEKRHIEPDTPVMGVIPPHLQKKLGLGQGRGAAQLPLQQQHTALGLSNRRVNDSREHYGTGKRFIQEQSSIPALRALNEEGASGKNGEKTQEEDDRQISIDNRAQPSSSSSGTTEVHYLQNSGHKKSLAKKSMSVDAEEISYYDSERGSPQLRSLKSGTNLTTMGHEHQSQVKPPVYSRNKLPTSSPSPAPRTGQQDKSSPLEDWIHPKAFVQPNTLLPEVNGSSRGSSLPRQAKSVNVDPGKKAVLRFSSGSNLLSDKQAQQKPQEKRHIEPDTPVMGVIPPHLQKKFGGGGGGGAPQLPVQPQNTAPSNTQNYSNMEIRAEVTNQKQSPSSDNPPHLNNKMAGTTESQVCLGGTEFGRPDRSYTYGKDELKQKLEQEQQQRITTEKQLKVKEESEKHLQQQLEQQKQEKDEIQKKLRDLEHQLQQQQKKKEMKSMPQQKSFAVVSPANAEGKPTTSKGEEESRLDYGGGKDVAVRKYPGEDPPRSRDKTSSSSKSLSKRPIEQETSFNDPVTNKPSNSEVQLDTDTHIDIEICWVCEYCTNLNPDDVTHCDVCKNPDPRKFWTCENCNNINLFSLDYCKKCKREKETTI